MDLRTKEGVRTLAVQVKKVLEWLYEDSTIYLPRKYEKYLEFQNYSSSNKAEV